MVSRAVIICIDFAKGMWRHPFAKLRHIPVLVPSIHVYLCSYAHLFDELKIRKIRPHRILVDRIT
jgi:hypothetical protein